MSLSSSQILHRISSNISTVMRGQQPAIRRLLAALAAGGHVLLEDCPGTGKTTLAKALAGSVDCGFKRIQFTPDLLPSDILGVSVYHQKDQGFHFHEGPIFSPVVLADEINRASPRTQSALLEAMAENQVSVDGMRRPLPALFFVIATQNPVESQGTYPLPEAQMDRFALMFRLGYVTVEEEMSILADQTFGHPLSALRPCASMADLLAVREDVCRVKVSEEIRRYIVSLVAATRSVRGVALGASPRASLTLMKAAQALALMDGQDFVSPEQVRELASDVLAHRLSLDPQARFAGLTGAQVVAEVLETVEVPA